MTQNPRHIEQFRRVKRWYERFKKIDQGIPHNRSSESYQDEVYTFFQNCHHLKDWIKNDDAVSTHTKEKVEDFIGQEDCLKLCADICNGTKHLKLNRERSRKSPEFGSRRYVLALGGKEPVIQVKWSITTKTGIIDAFQLASECLQKWEEFLKENL